MSPAIHRSVRFREAKDQPVVFGDLTTGEATGDVENWKTWWKIIQQVVEQSLEKTGDL